MLRTSLAVFALCALCASASAAPDGWHENLKDGLDAAKKSGKPLLVVTGWKSGI